MLMRCMQYWIGRGYEGVVGKGWVVNINLNTAVELLASAEFAL